MMTLQILQASTRHKHPGRQCDLCGQHRAQDRPEGLCCGGQKGIQPAYVAPAISLKPYIQQMRGGFFSAIAIWHAVIDALSLQYLMANGAASGASTIFGMCDPLEITVVFPCLTLHVSTEFSL